MSSICKKVNRNKVKDLVQRKYLLFSEMRNFNKDEKLIQRCGSELPHSIHALMDVKIAVGMNALNPQLAREFATQSMGTNASYRMSTNSYILTVVANPPFSNRTSEGRLKNFDYIYHMIKVLERSDEPSDESTITWNDVKYIIADQIASSKLCLFSNVNSEV